MDLNHPRYYTATLTSGEVQDQLLATVNRELAQYVREGRVQTAAIVTVGGYGPGYTLADLVGRLNVIWDNAPAHRREALREYLRTADLNLRLVNLPGYSPDFKADEAIWG